jgi:hypothetical protein
VNVSWPNITQADDCFATTIMTQPTKITQFIFGQPLWNTARELRLDQILEVGRAAGTCLRRGEATYRRSMPAGRDVRVAPRKRVFSAHLDPLTRCSERLQRVVSGQRLSCENQKGFRTETSVAEPSAEDG